MLVRDVEDVREVPLGLNIVRDTKIEDVTILPYLAYLFAGILRSDT
jgi:hypothetical protein